jgi:hypothetical protein
MFTRRALSGLVAAGVAGGALAETAQPGPAAGSQRAEAAKLRAFAEATHPRGREAAADPAWQSGWAGLDAGADALSPAEFVMGLMARLAWFKDGHTTVFVSMVTAPGFDVGLPIAARCFYDGVFITAARDEAAPLLGARIRRVAGVWVEDVIRRFVQVWPGNNPAWAHHDARLALTPAILRGAGLIPRGPLDAPVLIEAEVGGAPVKAMLTPRAGGAAPLTPLARKLTPVETWRPAAGGNFLHREGKALVIAFDNLSAGHDATVAFVRQAIAGMEDHGVERVILDLRRNGGGDNFLGEGLRKHLERSRFNRPGGLYVLIGPQTFSAAQNLTTRLERETYAVFVGEPSGGAPNHYGDAKLYEGPGFKAGVSTIPWFDSYPMDRRPWVMPDLLVPATFAYWKEGIDEAMEAALAHKEVSAPDDLSEARAFFFARPSQKQAWTPFWMT